MAALKAASTVKNLADPKAHRWVAPKVIQTADHWVAPLALRTVVQKVARWVQKRAVQTAVTTGDLKAASKERCLVARSAGSSGHYSAEPSVAL